MEKKNIDWSSLGFSYMKTDWRYSRIWEDGQWKEGGLTDKAEVTISECAGVLQYAQTGFEGLKVYETVKGEVVAFRPDLNAERLQGTCDRLIMPKIATEDFLAALDELVKANLAYVPPYGSGASLYIRPFIYGCGPVIGVAPAPSYEFRMFCTPVGAYFKGGVKPIRIMLSDFEKEARDSEVRLDPSLDHQKVADCGRQGLPRPRGRGEARRLQRGAFLRRGRPVRNRRSHQPGRRDPHQGR